MKLSRAMILALFAILAFQPAAAAPSLPAPVNLDFEQVDSAGRPLGWSPNPPRGRESFELGSAPGENGRRAGRIARLANAPAGGPQRGGLTQRIDAAPYRGQLVRLRGRVRAVSPGRHAGLLLLVHRPRPKFAGFQDPMEDRPIVANEWRTYEIRGRVAPDALVLEIGVSGAGDVDILFDDFTLEAVEPDPAPSSAEAAAYLEQAISALRRLHIDSPAADWDRIAADARAEIGGARTPADTYNAIRGMIGALGEKHTFFIPPRPRPERPDAAPAATPRADPPRPLPRYRLVDGRYGMVLVPGHQGSDEEDRRYRRRLQSGLQLLDAEGVCGWIVDLRGNSGGNMWPMLNGLDPLLAEAPFGSFVIPSAPSEYWVRHRGEIRPGRLSDRRTPFFPLRAAAMPVAVLFDGRTGSAGEQVAVALIGRQGVRTFGAPTGGYTTANQPFELPDGAVIALTSAFVRDRAGRDYRDTIAPDEPAPDALAAARSWLSAQPSCGR